MNMTARLALVILFTPLLVFNSGCTREDELLGVIESDIAKVKVDDLSRGMEFIRSEVRHDQREFVEQVSNGLNRWVTYSSDKLEDKSEGWQLSEFVKPVVDQYQSVAAVDRIDEYQFVPTDPYYLQQSYWIRRLLDRLDGSNSLKVFELYRFAADNYRPGEDVDRPVEELFSKVQPELKGDQQQAFVRTMKLFDWICRNVQLESSEFTEEELAERQIFTDQEAGPASGVPGLGYQRLPWQVVMYGRGDYVERAKLLMASLRFWDIDSVMFATGEDKTPWAVGVLIGEQYYLFDTRMGLPIPGEKLGSIATLAELRANPALLTRLDLTTDESLADDSKYWVRPADLKSLTALIYASPESISKRMKGVEASLVGDERMDLVFTMSDVVKRLPNVEGVTAEPWDVAFKTHQYRQAIQTARRQSASVIQDKLLNYYRTEGYIDEFRPYRTARGRFLIGKFQVKREERGLDALEGWQRLIYDDDQILSLASDFELQRLHGIRRDGQSKKEFDNEVAAIQGKMRLIRADAKFFLAQCLFDNANENAAGSWLEDLKTGAQGADRWLEGVSYLLGRSYESRGDYDRAIEMLSDESLVQSHGNLIRTRLLKQQIKNVYGDVSTKAEPKEEAKEDDQPEKAEGDKKDKAEEKAAATKKAEKETAPEKEAGGEESATSEAAEPVEEKPAEEKSEGEKSGKEG